MLSQNDASVKESASVPPSTELGGKLLSEPQPQLQQIAFNAARHGFHLPLPHYEIHHGHQLFQNHPHEAKAPAHSPAPAPTANESHTAGDAVKSALNGTAVAISSALSTIAGPFKHLPNPFGYRAVSGQYWQHVSFEKSHHRYATAFPPVYPGMDAPIDYPPAPTNLPPNSIKGSGHLSNLEDFTAASKELNRIVTRDKNKPDFQLSVLSEAEFKSKYAAESVHLGAEFNMTKDDMKNLDKRVYAFEGGGWGTYETLSGMPQQIIDDNQKEARAKFRPASDAIGYNQILSMETVNDIIQHGSAMSARLNELALEHPDRADVLHAKAQLVDGLHDVLVHKNTPFNQPPDRKSAYWASPALIQRAAQSLNLDGDVGPVIQSEEIYNLLKYFNDNKIGDYLNTKLNLETSHAAEYDKLDPDKKLAAVAELMQHIKPSPLTATNPESMKTFNSSLDSLRLKFIELGVLQEPGSPDPDKALERSKLTSVESHIMNMDVLTMRRYGGESGPLSKEARALLDKVTADYFGGFHVDQLQAAAVELANLAGVGAAQNMLNPNYGELPTSNFFNKEGYEANPVTSRYSVDELLLQIYRIMHGLSDDPDAKGMKQFDDAFDGLPNLSPPKN